MFPIKSTKVPNKKSITFNNKTGGMDVQLKYADGAEILPGLPTVIAQYTVAGAKLKQEGSDAHSYELCYDIENTLHQIPVLKEVNIIEKWQVEEKIAIKKPAPVVPPTDAKDGKKEEPVPAPVPETEQSFETKLKKKQTTSAVNFSFSFFGMVPEDIKKGVDTEAEMHKCDRKFLDLKESKNQLETVCYKWREWLQGKMAPFMEEQACKAVVAEITKTVDWLYDEGENSTFEDYTKRYTEFMKVLEPVKKRSIFHEEVPQRFALFKTCEQWTRDQLALEKLAHLSDEQRKSVNDKLALYAELMEKMSVEFNTLPKHQDCSFTMGDIDSKLRIMKAEIDPILATPVPAPIIVEEPKPEEKKDEANDAEKKDEPMP